MSTNSHPTAVDIVIAGAGMVGLPLAHVLARQGWQVVLLDAAAAVQPRQELPTEQASLEQRCTALSLSTQQWLQQHDLWAVQASDATPIRDVHVSQKGNFGVTRLHAHEINADALGYVVNNAHLVSGWQSRLSETTVDCRRATRVVAVEHQDDHVCVHLNDKTSIKTALLLAADGVSSVVRESLGIATRQFDYQQSAVLGTIELERRHDNVAYERFTSSGPLALLPRGTNYMSFVDCIDPADQEGIEKLNDTDYLQRLQSRFGYRLGRFKAVGPRLVIPLIRIEAQAQIAARTVLLGNAVRLLHPVGGQGYNLAMRDVAKLIDLLAEQLGEDPGASEMLNKFVMARRSDQKQLVGFTDALARGFRGQASIPRHCRAVALSGLDAVPLLRNGFALRATGLAE